jgi:hypothetical protein
MRSIVLGTALALMATSAHAAFSISGDPLTLPGTVPSEEPYGLTDPSGGPGALDPLAPGDTVLNNFTINAPTDSTIPIRLTYLGFEAANTNVTLDGTTVIFSTASSAIGETFDLTLGELKTDVQFDTSGTTGALPDTIEGSDRIAAAVIPDHVLQIRLGDDFGDGDFDDMAIQAAVVPLPAAVWMFGAGLAAVSGAAYRRRRAGATPAA